MISRRTRTIYKVRSTTLSPFAPLLLRSSLKCSHSIPSISQTLNPVFSERWTLSVPHYRALVSVRLNPRPFLFTHHQSFFLPSPSLPVLSVMFSASLLFLSCVFAHLLPFDAPPSPYLRSFRALSFPSLSDRTHGRHA